MYIKIIIIAFLLFSTSYLYSQDTNTTPETSLENNSDVLNEESPELEAIENNRPRIRSSRLETASEFMDKVAESYSTIQDFQARIEIDDGTISQGVVYSKPPNKVRINFSIPRDQVIVSDGEKFFVYIPQQNVVLSQEKQRDTTSTGTFITRSGIDQLRQRYIASYADKPYFVTLDSKNRTKVMQIRMRWKSTKQNFRELLLSIGEDFIIYRVEALTYNRTRVKFDFSDIQINKGIPDARFDYTPAATANVIENFLFETATQ